MYATKRNQTKPSQNVVHLVTAALLAFWFASALLSLYWSANIITVCGSLQCILSLPMLCNVGIMVRGLKDTVVWPNQGEWWELPNENPALWNKDAAIEPMNQTRCAVLSTFYVTCVFLLKCAGTCTVQLASPTHCPARYRNAALHVRARHSNTCCLCL